MKRDSTPSGFASSGKRAKKGKTKSELVDLHGAEIPLSVVDMRLTAWPLSRIAAERPL